MPNEKPDASTNRVACSFVIVEEGDIAVGQYESCSPTERRRLKSKIVYPGFLLKE